MASSGPRFDLIKPAAEAFARLPIGAAFDWSAITTSRDEGEWYVVAFRSTRRAGADEALLMALDTAAHEEASQAPGFVHYFKGPTNAQGECLSFCVWEGRPAAREAAGAPAHSIAAAVVREMYEAYRLEFIRLSKRAGSPEFEFAPFDPAPAGAAAALRVQGAKASRSSYR